MNTTKLYLIRHGETEDNKTGVLMGSTDTPLNAHGRRQAVTLRERIDALEVVSIYASPLQRAVETTRNWVPATPTVANSTPTDSASAAPPVPVSRARAARLGPPPATPFRRRIPRVSESGIVQG